MNKNLVYVLVAVILILAAGTGYAFWSKGATTYVRPDQNAPVGEASSSGAAAVPASGSPITVTGKIVCLPHKDTSGPQTLECALGLQTDSGTYYALSDEKGPAGISSIDTNQRIEVTGIFKPHSNSQYQDIGVITVTSATVVSR